MEYNFTYRDKDKGIQVILSYKDHLGRWRQKSKQGFKTKREAKLAGDRLLESVKEDLSFNANVDLQDLTFKDFADVFLREQSNNFEQSTIICYENAIKKAVTIHCKPLTDISHADMLQIINSIEGKPNTVNLALSKLKRIFNYAVKPYRIIKESPLNDIYALPKKKEQKAKALNQDKLTHLLNELIKTATIEHYTMASIAAYSGLRFGEIAGLTWSDIDIKNSEISVNKQWAILKTKSFGFKKLKSSNSHRIVPIPPVLSQVLIDYQNINIKRIDGRLFTSPNSLLNFALKKVNQNISIHTLRHTYATYLISKNIDVQTVAALLGDTTEVVISTYLHYNDDMRQQAKKQISKIF